MQTEYVRAFSDLRNEEDYEEFYQMYKGQYQIPPPLREPAELEKAISEAKQETEGPRSRSTSFLVSDVVDNGMEDEDAESAPPQYTLSASVPEFAPSFVPMNAFAYPYEMDLYTQAYEMAKDQFGCRTLQKKLEESPFILPTVFDQVYFRFPELMDDPFGNYLCQKILDMADQPMLAAVTNYSLSSIVKIALNPYGTRAVQKLVETTAGFPELADRIVAALSSNAVLLMQDTNGNHVIQKCLHTYPPDHNQFVFDVACRDMAQLATHRHGCCVLQRCIDVAAPLQKAAVIDKVIENTVELVQDAFGNYVVQYVLDMNDHEVNGRLAKIFIDHMRELSIQKFSSNVIEKCIQQNSPKVQLSMIQEICKRENIAIMIGDQYANYGKCLHSRAASPGFESAQRSASNPRTRQRVPGRFKDHANWQAHLHQTRQNLPRTQQALNANIKTVRKRCTFRLSAPLRDGPAR